MSEILDNINDYLLPRLQKTLEKAYRADFCVAYFNLHGWQNLDSYVDNWKGCENDCCRILIGMPNSSQNQIAELIEGIKEPENKDRSKLVELKLNTIDDFKKQMVCSKPTNNLENCIRRLIDQLKTNKVYIRLYLKDPLHAKLYLLYRDDIHTAIVGYLGSSNLTHSGLSGHGELNIEIVDQDACKKLSNWFNERWGNEFCFDISKDLVKVLEQSWVNPVSPYLIYMKMIYHLSVEARSSEQEFTIPKVFGNSLFPFQKTAVQIATQYLNKRGGVFIGDVVGLGKTLMATAVAKIMEDDLGFDTLIICPKNLESMWEEYRIKYHLTAKVMPISQVINDLPDEKRYKLVLIDESHNLRNPKGKRYKVIKDYIEKNDSKCILLSATPYNKSYLDLSTQLRLFVTDDESLGIRPEKQIKADKGVSNFVSNYGIAIDTIQAFEKSEQSDDWRDLMRLFLVRRTRSFIMQNYAKKDTDNGRKYLDLENGLKSYFPEREPKTLKFDLKFDESQKDQYSVLFSEKVVDTINELNLPRYGLGIYLKKDSEKTLSSDEKELIDNLARAGKRLKGFCRTGLFKRLESSGYVFIKSVERHVLRNFVFLYALDNNLQLPIGTQDLGDYDPTLTDDEIDDYHDFESENGEENLELDLSRINKDQLDEFKIIAKNVYKNYASKKGKGFKWIKASLFTDKLKDDLLNDSHALANILTTVGKWQPENDMKLEKLKELITNTHKNEKILLFTQFADTVKYLEDQFSKACIQKFAGVTGHSENPTEYAWRFSPESNGKVDKIMPYEQLRVLLATDVLSEGQNLQDCSIIINYDLPWAIIRLIQRVGRVDRIGQKSSKIVAYSFMPADGVEDIIKLRKRLVDRLQENKEVIGTDELFFDEKKSEEQVKDIYNEKSGILDDTDDTEVDLASYAYQIWKSAINANPSLEKEVQGLEDVVNSTKGFEGDKNGVIVYTKTGSGNDELALIDENGEIVTQSHQQILRIAQCNSETPALEKLENHHDLVNKVIEVITNQNIKIGNPIGPKNKSRSKTYNRLKEYFSKDAALFIDRKALEKAIDLIFKHPLQSSAEETLTRQLRTGMQDLELAKLVVSMYLEERLCNVGIDTSDNRARIICSLGLKKES